MTPQSGKTRRRLRAKTLAGVTAALLTTGALSFAAVAPAAQADTSPPTGVPATVSADLLPTVQINGVVWAEVTVGNTVYATGSFTKARPAGSAAGVNETTRTNLLAYDITTGALITSFNHSLNAQGRTIVASPDGSRVYVGGEFTTVDGLTRNRVAAFDTATGALVTSFAPNLNGAVRGLAATNSTLYITGNFTTAGGLTRNRAAAAAASNGAMTTWAPSLDSYGTAMVLSPDNSRVIIGGTFTTLNGANFLGIGAVSSTTGANVSWNTSFPIQDGGSAASYTSLVSDGTNIYGTTYQSGVGGNFEGRFAADPYTGDIVWMNSCHGDSYGAWPIGSVLYSVGHAHDCSDVQDFSQDNDNVFASTHHFAMAESTAATGVNRAAIYTGGNGIPGPMYSSFTGQPHSAELNWYPTMTAGSYTGQTQAAWSITGNSSYVSVGGEFPTVNGTAQQGLARFAVRSIATNKTGPAADTLLTPVARSLTPGTARVGWRAASDQDNVTLTYRLYRDSGTTPIYTTTVDSRFWYKPALQYVDTGLATGSSHTYKVTVTDPLGNARTSGTSSSVTIGTTSPSTYISGVLADGAANFWPLNESSGTVGRDYAGSNDLVTGSAVTRGASGPSAAGSATATTFDGTVNSIAYSKANGERRSSFSVEAWVKTTSTAGGQIVGYGVRNTENSVDTDRTLYLGTDGLPYFGVWSANTKNTVNGSSVINNGVWHHLVGSVQPGGGMSLYVDGVLVGSRAGITSGSVISGYWRVGGDSLAAWPNAPQAAPRAPGPPDPNAPADTAGLLAGSIADVAVYPTPLTAAQITAHYGSPVTPVNQAPTAVISSSGSALSYSFSGSGSTDADGTIAAYAWDFGDGTTGTGSSVAHAYTTPGTYSVKLTVTDNGGATGSSTTSITATQPVPTTYASDAFGRTVSNGWGSADQGGAWTQTGTASNFSVSPGAGQVTMATAGASPGNLSLNSVSAQDVDLATTFSLGSTPTGSGVTFYSTARRVGNTSQYRAGTKISAAGVVTVTLSKFEGTSTEVSLGSATVSGLTYTAGTKLDTRFQAVGASPTTLRVKVWVDGTTEPAAWQLSTTDSSATLQTAAAVGLNAYLSGSATASETVSVSSFKVTAP